MIKCNLSSLDTVRCDSLLLNMTRCKLILENVLDNEMLWKIEGYDWLN